MLGWCIAGDQCFLLDFSVFSRFCIVTSYSSFYLKNSDTFYKRKERKRNLPPVQ